MEKSINIHRALRATLRLLLTSVISIVFWAVGVVVGLLAEVIAGVLRILGNSPLRAHPRKYSRPYSLDIHPININQDENKTQ